MSEKFVLGFKKKSGLDTEIYSSLRGWFDFLLEKYETISPKCWTFTKLQRKYILKSEIEWLNRSNTCLRMHPLKNEKLDNKNLMDDNFDKF